ncbi:MAG TPA: acetylornithine transaminase [Segeticoccus sp.]|uniref:acetylornithine transaminase n=1 Tax=Segeticoccus sp. TaxID=2706531 RepID=UPI002D7E4291|nr:acetylornithine transaminase [Segeticoccus sp.]HET8600711.1 acetylornithine transaminase [Segeticoccus sp.]
MTRSADLLDRYQASLLGVFGRPGAVLSHGEGCRVWDVDGRCYLDLLAGIAVNSLGHAHPALVTAISEQAARAIHVSNFFTTQPQVELAERLLAVAGAPEGSAVFLTNSGTEAVEAAIKLARRTDRTRIVAMEGAFHGRSTGALALTHKPAYREPFLPLLPGITHVPLGDKEAVRAAVDETVAAVVVEPIQGEAGVRVADPAYLQLVRELTAERGALMVVDEIQTGIGRTGQWFAHQFADVTPDGVTVAKGLAGGVPIGALLTYGPRVSGLLTPGQHGTTFGGNPLAAAAALAVLDTIERDHLLDHVRRTGEELQRQVRELGHPAIRDVRGRGLLQAIELADDRAAAVAQRAREAGFLVNPVTPSALRLAPPLIITAEELATFVSALPALLDPTASEELP